MRIAPRFFVAALLGLAAAFAPDGASAFPQSTNPAMKDPSKATEKAPDTFRAKFTTTKGDIVFECTRAWAPNGVDRFYNLVKIGFFDDVAIFRVAINFVAQWGIHGDPAVSKVWSDANLPPDKVVESNKRGTLTYAMAGRPDTRSTQLFINYKDNVGLDAQGFAPICKVVEGMETADAFNGEYGERVTGMQGEIQSKGNAYLHEKWPNLDYIKTAVIVGNGPSTTTKSSSSGSEQQGPGILPFVVGGVVVGVILYYLMGRTSTPEPTKPEPVPSSVATTPPKKKKKKAAEPKEEESDDE